MYCKSLIWYFVGISTCMSEKFGTFSEKMVIFTKNLFTEVIEDSCKVFFTYTLDDKFFRIRKKEFFITIMRTVRYFLRYLWY